MVLAEGHDVEPDLVSLLGDLDLCLDALVLGRCAAGGRVHRDIADGEDPELHSNLFM